MPWLELKNSYNSCFPGNRENFVDSVTESKQNPRRKTKSLKLSYEEESDPCENWIQEENVRDEKVVKSFIMLWDGIYLDKCLRQRERDPRKTEILSKQRRR